MALILESRQGVWFDTYRLHRRRDEARPYSVVGRIRSMAIITVEEWQPGSLHGWPLPSS
jgi:hypothetical protein